MKTVLQKLRGAFPALGVAMAISLWLTAPASAQCTVNAIGSAIGPSGCGFNVGDNIAFIVDASNANVPGACDLAPLLLCFFPPDDTGPAFGQVCSRAGSDAASCVAGGGLALALPPGLILEPADFLRFSATDAPMVPNCAVASDVNCEYIVPALNYIASLSDTVGNGTVWRGTVCHLGITIETDQLNQAENQTVLGVKIPVVDIEKSVNPGKICEGTPTQVTYSYTVQWGVGATANLDNVVVMDSHCSPVNPVLPLGDGDALLEFGEVWNYSCTTSVSTETTNTGTVNADDACTNLMVSDQDTATVTANPEPTCEINGPSPVCPEATDLMYSAKEVSVPPLAGATFAWTISGATFCDGTTAATGETVCVDAPSTCDTSFTLDVTVTVGDCSSTCSKTVTVDDNTPPVITCPAVTSPIECPATPIFGPATATDNCDDAVAITFSDVTVPGDCPDEYCTTRTWTATDDCGNTATCSREICVVDTTPPVITCPTVTSPIECPATPSFGPATATDACDDAVAITFSDVTVPGDCPDEYCTTRTWTATDDCGNTATCSREICVVDTTPPVITCPDVVDATDCTATPSFGPAIATDACDDAVAITFTDTTTGSCPDTQTCVTRTWTATDDCNNSSTCNRTICVPCCVVEGFCRVTGGGNDQYGGNKYTHGGQAGAPDSIHGEWTHHQKSGPDHRFVFHAGTSSSPDETEIHIVTCSDPGFCNPARPAPDKQIDFEGVGAFKNIHGYNPPVGEAIAGNGGTFHWFKVHVEDLGEPGSGNPEPGADCPAEGSAGQLADCGCPDFYSITIYRDYDPDTESPNTTEVIYHVHGYMNGGNHQIHPALD